MGEPVEGGVGATTHSAHNQRGGWRRGGDALGAGEEGGTEEGHQENAGGGRPASGRGQGRGRLKREEGWGKETTTAGQHPRLGKEKLGYIGEHPGVFGN